MHHLHRVASEYESNNMTASNLAIVFGPTLLRRNEDTTSMTQVLETIHQARAVELLTIYVQVIIVFGIIPVYHFILFISSLTYFALATYFFNLQFLCSKSLDQEKRIYQKITTSIQQIITQHPLSIILHRVQNSLVVQVNVSYVMEVVSKLRPREWL